MSGLSAYQQEREVFWVRCRGCRRQLALSTGSRQSMYCDEFCAEDFPAVEHEDRNALMYAISLKTNATQQQLSEMFGVARQRVQQVLLARRKLL